MATFGMLNSANTINMIQQKLAALRSAFEDIEDVYLWLSAYTVTDLEAAPLSWAAADAQAVLNALADANDLYQVGLGTTGFPLASLPYNFFASQRMITGSR